MTVDRLGWLQGVDDDMSSLARRETDYSRMTKAQLIAALTAAEGRQVGHRVAGDGNEGPKLGNRQAPRKQALDAIVIEQMHEAVMVTDLTRLIVDANPAAEKLLARSRDEIIGHRPYEFLGGDYATEDIVRATEAHGQWHGETMVRPKRGTVRTVEIVVTPLFDDSGRLIARVGVFRDISERKRAYTALRQSEAKYRNLVEGSIQGVMIHRDGIIVYANRAYAKIHGYRVDEMIGMATDDQVAPEELETVRELRRQEVVQIPEFRGLRRDGSVVWLAAAARNIEWEGRPARQVTALDITDRRRAEQALRRQAVVMAQINDAVMITDLERRIIDCNRAAEILFGRSRDEMIGRSPSAFLADAADHERRVPEIMRLVGQDRDWTGEIVLRRKDGDTLVCELALAPLCDDDGGWTATIGIIRDLTERKRAEEEARRHTEELSQVLRRNTMGEMTSALAHELNQPLASIANYCRGCLHRLKSGAAVTGELIDAIDKASAQAERAGAIIRHIADLVRGGEPHREQIDINDIIRGIAPIAIAEANQNGVRIDLDLSGELAPVYAQPIEIQHVILNLLRNGIEAVTSAPGPGLGPGPGSGPGSGPRVTVVTERLKNGVIEVRIQDNGAGIPEDIQDRIFEPFFTTKEKGMGMGLAISRSIIDRNGGTLGIRPPAGGGANFFFSLPATTPARADAVQDDTGNARDDTGLHRIHRR